MSPLDFYYVEETDDCSYEHLVGPDNFSCYIGEPEDRSFSRDLSGVVDELNRLYNLIEKYEERIFKLKQNLCSYDLKAYPDGGSSEFPDDR